MKITYYPGCTLKANAKNFEDSAIYSYGELGIELVELPRWNCCGTVYSLATDDLMRHLAGIRTFIRVKEQGTNKFVTFCSMCYNTLKQVEIKLRNDEEALSKLNDFMYEEETKYDGDVTVIHGLTLLKEYGFDKLKSKVKNPLNKKIAAYYGCLLLRPKEVAIDDVENPTIMEDLISALGGEPIDFPFKNECCGAYEVTHDRNIIIERTKKIIENAQARGAEMIITSCPLCEFNLDNMQKYVKENYGSFKTIPVLYYTQVMAVAFGNRDAAHFELNYIKPEF